MEIEIKNPQLQRGDLYQETQKLIHFKHKNLLPCNDKADQSFLRQFLKVIQK